MKANFFCTNEYSPLHFYVKVILWHLFPGKWEHRVAALMLHFIYNVLSIYAMWRGKASDVKLSKDKLDNSSLYQRLNLVLLEVEL